MYEKLNFVPSPGAGTASEPNVTTSGMGDGYEERKLNGINADLKEYTLSFVIPRISVKAFNDFMNRHCGYKSFLILSPSRNKYVLVNCSKWSETTHYYYSTFNLTCKEVGR